MYSRRIAALAGLFLCLLGALPAAAVQLDCDGVYCFGSGDFSEEELRGVCITGLPEESVGTVVLGDRVIRPGDVLAADQLAQLTFLPVRTEQDATAAVTYLPVFSTGVGQEARLTISVRGRENQPPVAEDFAAETYKNLSVEGKLKVKDPEGESMTYTLIRQPKRGQVELRADGSFLYTPKKNKVGIDSFVFTATDASGKVSRETTVTITIVRPTDAAMYTDTLGSDCRFAAEWMKNTGIFAGEQLDGNFCFQPQKPVTQGEFLTMLVKTLDIPLEEAGAPEVFQDEVPRWLAPYLAAAVRSGLLAGVSDGEFRCDQEITGAEAAVMLQNALALTAAEEAAAVEGAPDWAADALAVLHSHGITLDARTLTREQAAQALYQAHRLAQDAPGMIVIGRQR